MARMVANARMYLQVLLYVSCTYIFTFYHRPEYRVAQLKQLIVPSPNKVFQQQQSRSSEQQAAGAGVVCQFAFSQHFAVVLKSFTSFVGFPFRLVLLYVARLVAHLVVISYDVGDFFSEAVFNS